MKLSTRTAAVAAAVQGLFAGTSAFHVGQSVKTSSGTVIGHRAPNATQVGEYLGIPYAQPPLGSLRFAPPQPYTSNRTINASSHGHDCPSLSSNVPTGLSPPSLYNILADLGQVEDQQREDCLYINVWNKPQSGAAYKPVLVWIYGGGFNIGGTNTSAYSGQYFADTEDVVFVNFNYRLNIFGFPGASNLVQNAGLLDQRLAIEWVRDNIAAFGGDPSRITIFGQSAGGASVDYYNYAWTRDPIIAGSIAESGTATSFGNLLPETANSHWTTVAGQVGCNQSTEDAVLACMRNMSMASLITAENKNLSGLAAVQGSFGPTIDNKTVFSNYTDLAQNKEFIQRPYIFGNNYNEAGLFILIAAGSGVTLPASDWTDLNELTFTCPATTAAIWRANEARVPTWRYIYKAVFPNEYLPTDSGEAWHGAELLPLFGTSESITKTDSTWQERSMGNYLRGAWAAFAADPVHGLDVYGWKRYSNLTESVIQLGFDNTSSTTFSVYPSYNSTQAYDTGCPPFPDAGIANK